uniref:VWFD domain-containing protein n=1 Tax=Cuerna arida TaxID=1464854 RepID=A0A1B6G4B4_9HEMI
MAVDTEPDKKDSNAHASYNRAVNVDVRSKGLKITANYVEKHHLELSHHFAHTYQLDYQLGDGPKHKSIMRIECAHDKFEIESRVFDTDLIRINAKKMEGEGSQNGEHMVEGSVAVFGSKKSPIVFNAQVKNFNTFIVTAHRQATPDRKLKSSGGLILGQIADYRIETIDGATKNSVLHASVQLDEANFLKSEYGFDNERAKSLLKDARDSILEWTDSARAQITKMETGAADEVKRMWDNMDDHWADFQPVSAHYKEEFEKIAKELASDRTVQDATKFLRNVLAVIVRTMADLIKELREFYNKLKMAVQENVKKVCDVIAHDFIPEMRKAVQKLVNVVSLLIEEITKIVFTILIKMADILKMYQTELNSLATSISESMQDFARAVTRMLITVKDECAKLVKDLYEEIKATPFAEFVREKWENVGANSNAVITWRPSEQFAMFVDDILYAIHDMLPNDDLKKAVATLQAYISKKLRGNDDVNDWQEIKTIVNSVISALDAILKECKSSDAIKYGVHKMAESLRSAILSTTSWQQWSQIALSGNDVNLNPTPIELLRKLRKVRTQDILYKFDKMASLIQGRNVITFDRRNVTLPTESAQCSFMLVSDAQDRNFTIFVDFATDGAKIDGITLIDREGDTFTLKDGGRVAHNGQPADFPVRSTHSAAFRKFHSVYLASHYGIEVGCLEDLTVCGFMVSGFYHGRLRGLLGNGNNDPYDDYTLPNGKLAQTELQFISAYTMPDTCTTAPKATAHEHHEKSDSSDICEQIFEPASQMAPCYPFVDVTPFKHACQHGVATKMDGADCAAALAYVATCAAHRVWSRVPDKCVKCNDAPDGKVRMLGEKIAHKQPAQMADIVIVLDQNTDYKVVYEQLIKPLTVQIRDKLTTKGVKDVRFVLIGYGGGQRKWPSLFTSSNGNLKFDGSNVANSFKFTDKENDTTPYWFTDSDTVNSALKALRNTVFYELFLDNPVGYNAYKMAKNYPFRAGALKAILMFPHDCVASKLIYLARLQIWLYGRKNSIAHHTFTNVADMKLKTNEVATKDIVSFSKQGIQFRNGEEMKNLNDLRYEYENMCADTTLHLGGSVYSADNFVVATEPERKQFSDVFAQNVVADMLTQDGDKVCTCARDNLFSFGRFSCK